MCAGPRAHHILRNLPPSEVTQFCEDHDNRLRSASHILSVEVPDGVASEVVQLPFREGGLGLRSAARLAPAAYWASWADCLSQEHHMCVLSSWKNWRDLLREHNACEKPRTQPRCWPVKAWNWQCGPDSLSPISARSNQSIQRLESGLTVGNFTLQLLATPSLQLACTCHRCPQTTELCGHCNEVLVLRATSTVCPLVRSTFSAEEFRTLLLPLHLDARFCKCGELLDVCHHRSACSRVGLLKPRGTLAEVCMARICREAGARVEENQLLRDLNIVAQAPAQD